jgi:four helix bundle protein
MATGLENLWIYSLAEDLEIEVYEVTKIFPRDEIFRSVDQLRRSSASVSNNIAESYHKTTLKEKLKFLNIAKGEAEETKRGLLRAARKKLLSEDIARKLAERYTILLKGTSSYIRFLSLNSFGRKTEKRS